MNRKLFLNSSKKKISPDLTENSQTDRKTLKSFIIKNKLISYECEKCKNLGHWLEEKLSLHLEHKNGINNDNRIENLCFLCPNCHSQTKTYAGRNCKNIKSNICFVERNLTLKESTEDKILRIQKMRKFEVNIVELKKLVDNNVPFTTIGKMFGVSDNAIRKRCKALNINVQKYNRSLR